MIQQPHSWAYTWRKATIQKNICIPVFTGALFTIARIWKQPKCPSTEEWIEKMWYLYKMEYYSAIKKNETVPTVETWMDLETIIQGKVSKKERQIPYNNAYMQNLSKWYRSTYLQSRKRDIDKEKKCTYTDRLRKGGME